MTNNFILILALLLLLFCSQKQETVYVYPEVDDVAESILRKVKQEAKQEGVKYLTCATSNDTFGLAEIMQSGYIVISCEEIESDIESIDAETLHRVYLTSK